MVAGNNLHNNTAACANLTGLGHLIKETMNNVLNQMTGGPVQNGKSEIINGCCVNLKWTKR